MSVQAGAETQKQWLSGHSRQRCKDSLHMSDAAQVAGSCRLCMLTGKAAKASGAARVHLAAQGSLI